MKFLIFLASFISTLFIFNLQTPTLADGTYANLGTADALDGSADAINFSQGRVWTIDQYGKYIWLTQGRSGPNAHWAWSNDLGANWSQGAESYSFLIRGSVAYDSINDKLHVIWTTNQCDSGGGIIYRRYGITRDGSNNITAIAREDSGNINLQLDITGDVPCQQPVAIWNDDGTTNGSLIAIWTKAGGGRNEVRASMRQLSLSAADGVATNWAAPDGTADVFSTNAPEVDADMVYGANAGSNGSSAKIRGGSGSKKDDLYVFVQTTQGSVLSYRAAWNDGTSNWSGGWQTPVTVASFTSTSGYDAKRELITKPVIDTTNDRLYIGWADYLAGGLGDSVRFAYLDSDDNVSTLYTAYSANGTHSYAPTLDIAFDDTRDEFYVAYVESTTNGDNGSIDYKVFDGTTLGDEVRFYTSPGGSGGQNGSADIPILYESRSSNDRLLFGFRINGALPPTGVDPHTIDWGYITLAAAPTPTPSPTPSPQTTSSSSDNSSSTSSGPPACTDTTPTQIPNLFQIDTAGTFVQLHFTTVNGSSGYNTSYGLNQNSAQYADNFSYSGPQWTYSRIISGLSPNTTYSFKIQATNGCTAGDWSKTITIKTKSRLADITAKFASLNPFKQAPTPPDQTPAKPLSCIYTVQPGDSLWRIAQNVLGSGTKFSQLITSNPEFFTGNISSSMIKVGWQLKVC